ncbi:HNH endonuclease [Halomonas shengliensis]|uniref:HNH endonuclease n=1 Tax=Halomonas shengliensis TaxID=419597 RepID=UPI00115F8C61|nr:HNH endonuclease [Halomonas shengliensis]
MAHGIVRRTFHGCEVLASEKDRSLLMGDGWYVSQYGYLVRRVRGARRDENKEFFHRVVAGAGPSEQVDHINGDKLDNRRENLRICSHADNMKNRKTHRNNGSGFKGVYPDRNKWRAKITVNGKVHRLGTFETPAEAHGAYCRAAKEFHKDYARLS